jgi:membrane-associated phospholipid phosphatase
MTTFGALPSGHCVFPVIGLLTAWRFATWRTWPLHLAYTLSMICASAYLDHHWLIDGLAAWLVSAAAVAVVAMVLRRLGRSLSATEGTVEKGSRGDLGLNVST